MNLILAIVAGGVIGWIAHAVLNTSQERSLRTSLFIGMFGGLLGAQLAPIFGVADSSGGNLNVFLLVIAAASAAGCLVAANMIARRSA